MCRVRPDLRQGRRLLQRRALQQRDGHVHVRDAVASPIDEPRRDAEPSVVRRQAQRRATSEGAQSAIPASSRMRLGWIIVVQRDPSQRTRTRRALPRQVGRPIAAFSRTAAECWTATTLQTHCGCGRHGRGVRLASTPSWLRPLQIGVERPRQSTRRRLAVVEARNRAPRIV